MARSGSEQRKASRKRRLSQGLALGAVALGVPAMANAIIARRAARLAPAPQPRDSSWHSQTWASALGEVSLLTRGHHDNRAPVVFLHSLGPGHSSRQWIQAAGDIARRRNVVLIDLIGWGSSDRPHVQYSLDLSVDLLHTFAGEWLDGPFHLVASGEGAPLALSLAESSDQVLSVALSGPAGLRISKGKLSLSDRGFDLLLGAPILGTSAVNAYTRRDAIERNLTEHQMGHPSAEQIDLHYHFAHLPGSERSLAAYLRGRYERSLESLDLSDDLETWVGWGRKATGEPVEDADLWLTHLATAELVVFEQAASWPHVDQPHEFAKELLRFLRGSR